MAFGLQTGFSTLLSTPNTLRDQALQVMETEDHGVYSSGGGGAGKDGQWSKLPDWDWSI